MPPEINESTAIQINMKVLIAIVVVMVSAAAWFIHRDSEMNSRIEAAMESPKPGTGIYVIDKSDPNAASTWPVSKMEFQFKGDQEARRRIDIISKALRDADIKVSFEE